MKKVSGPQVGTTADALESPLPAEIQAALGELVGACNHQPVRIATEVPRRSGQPPSAFGAGQWAVSIVERSGHTSRRTWCRSASTASPTRVLPWRSFSPSGCGRVPVASSCSLYENQALALLERHQGRLLSRVRAIDKGPSEIHLLEFVTDQALVEFQNVPDRRALSAMRDQAIERTEVTRVRHMPAAG